MLIQATEEFSQAVYLASEVSEPNKNGLCAAHLHTHTHTNLVAAQHGGFLVTEVTCP